jgi:hypothetical protein
MTVFNGLNKCFMDVNLNAKSFDMTKRNFVNAKLSFEVHTTMNSSIIHHDNTRYKCIQKYQRIEGAHLIGLLKKSVDKKLESGFIPPSGLKQPTVDYFHLDNIEANLNELVSVIDLSSAYWTAAYRLGYLTSTDYYMTWHKEEWKHGKVAAVGALNKSVYVDSYVNGLLVEKSKVLQTDKVKQDVRLHILNYIHDLMQKLAVLAGTSFLSIQTDAITMVCEPKHLSKVFSEIADSGFKYKIKKVMFRKVADREITVSDFPNLDYDRIIKYGENNIYTLKPISQKL